MAPRFGGKGLEDSSLAAIVPGAPAGKYTRALLRHGPRRRLVTRYKLFRYNCSASALPPPVQRRCHAGPPEMSRCFNDAQSVGCARRRHAAADLQGCSNMPARLQFHELVSSLGAHQGRCSRAKLTSM